MNNEINPIEEDFNSALSRYKAGQDLIPIVISKGRSATTVRVTYPTGIFQYDVINITRLSGSRLASYLLVGHIDYRVFFFLLYTYIPLSIKLKY